MANIYLYTNRSNPTHSESCVICTSNAIWIPIKLVIKIIYSIFQFYFLSFKYFTMCWNTFVKYMIFNIIYYYIKHKTFPRFSSTLAMFTHAQAITFAVDIPFHCDLFLILMFFRDVKMLGKRKTSDCETGQVFSPQEKSRKRVTISPRWRIWKLNLCATLKTE